MLSVVDRVTVSWDEPFTLHDLFYFYEVRIKERNRLALHAGAKKNALVDGVQSDDRGWKNLYIFVKRSSLRDLGNLLSEAGM